MGASEEFEQELENIEDYVTRINDDIIDDVEGVTSGGEEIQGYFCSHGAHNYTVVKAPNWEYFGIRYRVNIDHAVAVRTTKSEINETGEVSLSDAKLRRARERLEEELQATPPSERKQVRLNLLQILSRESVVVELDTTEPINIHGFNLIKYFFPSEGIAQFHRDVQGVVNLGWVGQEFLMENFGLMGEGSQRDPGPGQH